LSWIDDLKVGLIDYLINPKRITNVRHSIIMDDDSVRTFHGCHVLHKHARGPAKGGIRDHPVLPEHESTALAALVAAIRELVDVIVQRDVQL
jgi:glutamate dehydrogenase/leucine dehydrogenase